MAKTNEKTLIEVKKMILRFNELWNKEAINNLYLHSPELKDLATKLESMKLSDSFFLSDLTEEEQNILNNKVYIISHL